MQRLKHSNFQRSDWWGRTKIENRSVKEGKGNTQVCDVLEIKVGKCFMTKGYDYLWQMPLMGQMRWELTTGFSNKEVTGSLVFLKNMLFKNSSGGLGWGKSLMQHEDWIGYYRRNCSQLFLLYRNRNGALGGGVECGIHRSFYFQKISVHQKLWSMRSFKEMR